MSKLFILLSVSICCNALSAQIGLTNPSFEDSPADATMPSGWWLVEPGTTPDILPGFWGVYEDASEGDTYIGLISRSDGSFEAIGQRLGSTVKKDNCYQFSIDISHSDEYVGYNTPIKLRIYLGSKRKKRDQLIYESEKVDTIEWETMTINFSPDQDYRYIIIEAFSTETNTGNILLDNISLISGCNRA